MSKKIFGLVLSTFVIISCGNGKIEERTLTNVEFDSIDLMERVIEANHLEFEREGDNNFSVTTDQSVGNYTVKDGKITEIKFDELKDINSLKPKAKGIKRKWNNEQITSTYSYDDEGRLVAANTNGQEFRNDTFVTEDKVIQNLSIDGEIGVKISLTDDSVKKEFINGSYLLASKVNESEMNVEYDGNTIAKLQLDSNGNYIQEEDEFGIKYLDYDEDGNITHVADNDFNYAVEKSDVGILKSISIGNRFSNSSYEIDGATKKYLIDGEEYKVAEDEIAKNININGKSINYINNVRENPYEQIFIESIEIDGEQMFSYKVDNVGNIVHEETCDNIEEYSYDYLGQISEWSQKDYLTSYFYDSRGNLVEEVTSDFSNIYEYGNSDVLLSYNGESISYDNIYNILSFGDNSYSYERGNLLQNFTNSQYHIDFKYDYNNVRKSAVINGEEHRYYYVDSKLILENYGENQVFYLYDSEGKAIGFKYCDNNYFYLRDAKQCIRYVLDTDGNIVLEYDYDPWGNILDIKDFSIDNLSCVNKILYKGYYYDFETNLYYLMTRYYSPVLKRFITRDSLERISATGTSDLNLNLFAYANNNPIMKGDPMGYEAIIIGGTAIAVALIVAIIAVVIVISITVLIYLLIDALIESGVCDTIINAINKVSNELKQLFREISNLAIISTLFWLTIAWKW